MTAHNQAWNHVCDLPEPEEVRQTFDCPVCGRHWYAQLEWGHVYVERNEHGVTTMDEWRPGYEAEHNRE